MADTPENVVREVAELLVTADEEGYEVRVGPVCCCEYRRLETAEAALARTREFVATTLLAIVQRLTDRAVAAEEENERLRQLTPAERLADPLSPAVEIDRLRSLVQSCGCPCHDSGESHLVMRKHLREVKAEVARLRAGLTEIRKVVENGDAWFRLSAGSLHLMVTKALGESK